MRTDSQVSFSPERVTQTLINGAIRPATAATLVGEFEPCPRCGHDIKPTAKDAKREDRDVLWEDDIGSTAHKCSNCNGALRIFVEEKVAGVLDEVPSESPDCIRIVPVEDSQQALIVNRFHMKVSASSA
jgi:uncharacterized protein with PIN domain